MLFVEGKPENVAQCYSDTQTVKILKSSTYSLLHLSLVGFDLVLKFVCQILETLLVFAVFVRLERQLLEAAVSLAHVLLGLCVASLFVVQLSLQLPDLQKKLLPLWSPSIFRTSLVIW